MKFMKKYIATEDFDVPVLGSYKAGETVWLNDFLGTEFVNRGIVKEVKEQKEEKKSEKKTLSNNE